MIAWDSSNVVTVFLCYGSLAIYAYSAVDGVTILFSYIPSQAGKGGELTHDETTIITGALDLTQKTAKDAMTPLSKTFSLDINCKLDMYVSEFLDIQYFIPLFSLYC